MKVHALCTKTDASAIVYMVTWDDVCDSWLEAPLCETSQISFRGEHDD